MRTVEDYIELLAGLKEQSKFQLDKSDYNLVTSLARQVYKGIGFTDRQYELAKEKLKYYNEQFTALDYDDVETVFDSLRLPVRTIDRSRWVKIVDHPGNNVYQSDDKGLWIAVRFIFQKKLIGAIDGIKKTLGDGIYDKENKIHYFPFNERTAYEIVSNFNETNSFAVDEELQVYYEKLMDMKNNKEKYLPGIYGLKLKNLHEKSLDYAISSIGEPNIENLCHYYDQKEKFGLFHFDNEDLQRSMNSLSPFAKRIVNRTKQQVLVNSKEYSIENLAEVILELYRFPLLVILNEDHCYDELVKFHRAFNGIIQNESCSVLFRLDNDKEGVDFNQYIKRNELNNKVDKNTKIVYISNSKVPKPLLQSEWFPNAAVTTFSGHSYGTNKVDAYLSELDLVIHYDDDISPWKKRIIEKV